MKYIFLVSFLFIASMAIGQTTFQCGAMTKSGTHCLRRVDKEGECCWQHGGQVKESCDSIVVTPCGVMTKAGTPCKNKVKGGGKCHLHKS